MKKLLIVEDSEDQRLMICEILKASKKEYELDQAADGGVAAEKLKSSVYDLVLLDYKLPVLDGLQVLEKLRSSGNKTPVVMMTADRNADVTLQAMKLGVSDYVLKKDDFHAQLCRVIESVLEKVDLEMELDKVRAESDFQAQKLANMGKILGEVLHDLRNPLSIIATSLEAIRDAKDQQKAVKLTLELMIRNMGRAKQIINSLLDFSRPKEYAFEPVDVRPMIDEMMGHLRLKCEKQGIKLGVEAADGLPKAVLDQQHFKGALLNMLMNAIEAMPEGGSLTVGLSAEPADRKVRIAIVDTGVGIKEEDQKRLGQRYFTTKKTGTGLGLLMTHEIIAKHRGSIGLDSAPGKGTTFTILLPQEGSV